MFMVTWLLPLLGLLFRCGLVWFLGVLWLALFVLGGCLCGLHLIVVFCLCFLVGLILDLAGLLVCGRCCCGLLDWRCTGVLIVLLDCLFWLNVIMSVAVAWWLRCVAWF